MIYIHNQCQLSRQLVAAQLLFLLISFELIRDLPNYYANFV